MKRCLIFLLALFFIFTFSTAALGAPPAPTREFYVNDYAGVLDGDTKGQIISLGAQLEQRTGAQVVVVTLKSLEGQPLEDVSLDILRGWGVGQKKENNGVVILVSTGDRKSRIEVGYGLEGILPDGKTGAIQDQYMVPNFKKNDYNKGILEGYQAVLYQVYQEYGDQKGMEQNPRAISTQPRSNPRGRTLILVFVMILLFFVDRRFFHGFFFYLILSMLGRGGFRGGGGGGGFGGSSGGGGSGGGGGSSRGW